MTSLFGETKRMARYKRFRMLGKELNSSLIRRVPKPVVLKCGKKLGMLKGKTLVLGSEDELSVLFDYCLYSYRRNGKNAIQRYLEQSPPPADSEQMLLLQAMCKAYYSLFAVEKIHTGKGATMKDLLMNRCFVLMDIGIGETALPGMIFAGRVLPFEDFSMTSGTFIPIDRDLMESDILPVVERLLQGKKDGDAFLTPGQEATFSGQIIRAAVRAGIFDRIEYSNI